MGAVMAKGLDLNELRTRVLTSQKSGESTPDQTPDKVLVTRDGKIIMGKDAEPDVGRELAEVHQGVFAGIAERLRRDQQVARMRLPRNAEYDVVDGYHGWYYEFVNELGDYYTMFLYFDGSTYMVKVVVPEVEGRYSPHDGHLYDNGTICFGPGGGMPTLESAFAKSVLWSNGFSLYEAAKSEGRRIPFPFSINNV
jgi:hypothetical protein